MIWSVLFQVTEFLNSFISRFSPDRISYLTGWGEDIPWLEFEEIVAAFRDRYPKITLATDMIVGFPGRNKARLL